MDTEPTNNNNNENSQVTFYSQFGEPKSDQHPVLYSSHYNISFMGLEKLHPFDSCKYRNIVNHLIKKKIIKSESDLIKIVNMPSDEILRTVHTKEYLDSLNKPSVVAMITELFFIAWFPNWLVQSRVIEPVKYATSGSILAGKVAMEKGHAINLGGGYHHCCGYDGGGFCPLADITLSIYFMRQNYSQIKNVMIIDLDAHQGNGHERDKLDRRDDQLYILDLYNRSIYPGDTYAKEAINCKVEVTSGIKDEDYLSKLQTALDQSFSEFTPEAVYYNAGTDILEGDSLGRMQITREGVKRRDEMVFRYAKERKIPIVMLLSGGYQRVTAEVIADSIGNLNDKFQILS
mmetsp:Transcript_25326/g.35499  ORF Transcript_25326/g.35499 Transcript_25326/m.35499 type:complete len:346 (-) Transcript_25326:1232-2269(-)